MCSLLKRDVSMSFKAKGNPVIPVLACNVLQAAFQEEENWPDSFVKVSNTRHKFSTTVYFRYQALP